MVSMSARRACWAALEAAPPYTRFYNHSSERIRTLACGAVPSTAASVRHVAELNALRALQILDPCAPVPQQLLALAVDCGRGEVSLWRAAGRHLLRPGAQHPPWSAPVLYGAARFLVGRWHTPLEQGDAGLAVKPLWAYGLLGLPQYALMHVAAKAERQQDAALSAAALAAAVLCAGVVAAARLCVDGAYAVSAVPTAIAVLAVGLAVDMGLVVLRACRATSHASPEPMLFFLGPGAVPPQTPNHSTGLGAADEPHARARAHEAAQKRIAQVQRETRAFARLATLTASDPMLMSIFAQEVDIDGYVQHTMHLLRLIDHPDYRVLFLNRTNIPRLTVPQVMDHSDAWQRRRSLRPKGIEAYEGLENGHKRNAKLWALLQAFAFTGPTDDRLPFVTLQLLQAQAPANFDGYARCTHKASDPASVALREYRELLERFGPVLRQCVEHAQHGPLHMWDFYERFYDQDCGERQDAPLIVVANRLTAKLMAYRNPKTPIEREGMFVAAEVWQRLQLQCQESSKGLRNKLLAVHPDSLQKVLDQRRLRLKAHGRLSFETAMYQEEEAAVRVWLKDYADALTALVIELSRTADTAESMRATGMDAAAPSRG